MRVVADDLVPPGPLETVHHRQYGDDQPHPRSDRTDADQRDHGDHDLLAFGDQIADGDEPLGALADLDQAGERQGNQTEDRSDRDGACGRDRPRLRVVALREEGDRDPGQRGEDDQDRDPPEETASERESVEQHARQAGRRDPSEGGHQFVRPPGPGAELQLGGLDPQQECRERHAAERARQQGGSDPGRRTGEATEHGQCGDPVHDRQHGEHHCDDHDEGHRKAAADRAHGVPDRDQRVHSAHPAARSPVMSCLPCPGSPAGNIAADPPDRPARCRDAPVRVRPH